MSNDQISTPTPLVYRMCEKIKDCGLPYNFTVLEPSAGRGAIAYIVQRHYTENVWCCETDKSNRAILGCNYKFAEDPDFFKVSEKYDLIIGNPPFGKGVFIKHMKKMVELSNKAVISIFPLSVLLSPEPSEKKFWQNIKNLSVNIEFLPADSFKSSGSDAETGLIVIKK